MENAQTILVIILSTALAISLVLSIILLVLCIRIAKTIRRITDKAEQIADKAEDFAEFVSHAGSSLAAGKIIANIFDLVTGKNKSKRK